MRFNNHWQVDGKHAFLGASKPHWINYDLAKMQKIWENKFASDRGTRLHKFAAEAIKLKIRMKRDGTTLNTYINDAIGYRMTPEQVLFINDDCFGTPDAIQFEKRVLRIHDLKTGVHPGDFRQLRIYCAMFCLEYKINPYDIEMIVRMYQSDAVLEEIVDPKEVKRIMELIQFFCPEIDKMREVML